MEALVSAKAKHVLNTTTKDLISRLIKKYGCVVYAVFGNLTNYFLLFMMMELVFPFIFNDGTCFPVILTNSIFL